MNLRQSTLLLLVAQNIPTISGRNDEYRLNIESETFLGPVIFGNAAGSSSFAAIVMPLHEPKFIQSKHFAISLLKCKQAAHFAFYPVLSDNSTMMKYIEYLSKEKVKHVITRPIIVSHPPGHWCFQGLTNKNGCNKKNPESGCIFSTTACICGRKKLLAMKMIFSTNISTHRYAIALDGDSEFQSMHNFLPWFQKWSNLKQVVAWSFENIPPKEGNQKWTKELLNLWWSRGVTASCEAVHQPDFGVWTWWGNVPVYEKKDFDDFWSFLDFKTYLKNYGLIFDHMAYMCYKVGVQGWKIKLANYSLEFSSLQQQNEFSSQLLSDQQQHEVRSNETYFLWSMERTTTRLFRYNMDRKGPGELGLEKRTLNEIKIMLDAPLVCRTEFSMD